MRPIVTAITKTSRPPGLPTASDRLYSHRSKTPVSSYEAREAPTILYVRGVAGGPSEEIRLTDFGWEEGVADWSPDSRKLVFDSMERGGAPGIYKPWIVTIDPVTGKTGERGTAASACFHQSSITKSWSPKVTRSRLKNDGDEGRVLWVVSLDGNVREARPVHQQHTRGGGLDWTPDGKTIVYCGLTSERLRFLLFPFGRIAPETDRRSASLMHRRFSPDGRWVPARGWTSRRKSGG